jgi:hypothetical protein
MEIKYNLTEEDYLNFNIFTLKRSKTAMRALKIQRFFAPILFIILSFVMSKVGDIPFWYWFITFLIMGIIWAVFYPNYFFNSVTRRVKKMLNEGKNNGFLGEHVMLMNEVGINESTSSGETKVNWSGITDFQEDTHYFYLYNSAVSAFILPKRELNNVDEIKNYIKSKLTI